MFVAYLKDRETPLDFNDKCNSVNYKDNKLCVFKNVENDKELTLAMIPYDNILYIKNRED